MKSDFAYEGLPGLVQGVCHLAMTPSFGGLPLTVQPTLKTAQTEVLQQVLSWIKDPRQTNQILWVCGETAPGRKFVAQSVVDACRSSKQLGGGFFFQSGVQECAEGIYLFPTIAYQLATNISGLEECIMKALYDHTPSKKLPDQFHSLIVQPMQGLLNPSSEVYVIVIDGVNECDDTDNMQQSILSCIAESVGLKLPFRFLITSRDQPNIRQAFDSDRFRGITLRIHLGSSSNIYLPQPSLQFSATGKPFAIDKSKPRRRALKRPFQFPSYPRIVTLGQRNGHDESYCRSLLSAGHGFPMWKPSGNLAMPVEFLRRGVSIGDVGIIDTYGFFKFYFNIFLPPDDPINANLVPREFCPIEPLLQPDEVVHEEEYFKPGHIIVSKGVTMEKHSKCPLDISFDSTELDGAILILPNGASREDLVSTERFHEYARKNAPHWYQYINHYGHTFHANGSLFLVTGCDKANDWALASFPYHAKRAGEPLRLQYTWQPQYDTPWFDPGTCCTDYYVPTKKLADHPEVKNQCVFLRGMRISLTQSSWQKTLPFDDDAKRHYTFILHTPSKFQLWLNSIFVSLRLRLSEKRAVNIITHRDQHIFHPNYIISQILLAEYPNAELALVNDSDWCPLVDNSLCTDTDINELVTKILRVNKVAEHNGIITFLPKTSEEVEAQNSSRTSVRNLLLGSLAIEKSTRWVKTVPIYSHVRLFGSRP